MSLLFSYKSIPVPHAVWTLFGRTERPRPIILVSVNGPTGVAVKRAFLDSGADDTVFPESVATDIGIDLSSAPAGAASGVGKIGATLRYAEVTLRITDGKEFREWPARIGFTSAPMHFPLLGFAGFLQFFTTTFYGESEKVELTVNNLYPGT